MGKTRKYGRYGSGIVFQHTHFEDLKESSRITSGLELK
jgi:hypothetical protein